MSFWAHTIGRIGGLFMENRDINALLEGYYSDPNAQLLDVREADEYAGGHIPGAKNAPLQALRNVADEIDLDTPLYIYCQSGGRSFKAATVLRGVGYTNVTDLGGINRYKGELEK